MASPTVKMDPGDEVRVGDGSPSDKANGDAPKARETGENLLVQEANPGVKFAANSDDESADQSGLAGDLEPNAMRFSNGKVGETAPGDDIDMSDWVDLSDAIVPTQMELDAQEIVHSVQKLVPALMYGIEALGHSAGMPLSEVFKDCEDISVTEEPSGKRIRARALTSETTQVIISEIAKVSLQIAVQLCKYSGWLRAAAILAHIAGFM